MKNNNYSPEEYTITQLKNGDWRGTLRITHEGEDDFIAFEASTKEEVLKKISGYQIPDTPSLNIPKTLFFSDWAEFWYESHRNKVQASTFAGYQFTLKLLVARFGAIEVTNITPSEISEYLLSLVSAGNSKSKIDKCRAMLIQIFDLLVEKRMIKANPAHSANKVKYIRTEDSPATFTEEEVSILFRELPDDKIGHGIRILLGCGLRVQELLALTPQDISPDGSTIKVRQAVKTVGGKAVVESLENTYALREIPVPLVCHSSALFLRKNASGKYVFCQKDKVHSVGTFRHWYENAIEDISYVRPLPPHCCQHTYAALLESKGVAKGQIAHLLGHSVKKSKASSTQLSKESLRKAVEVLNDSFTEQP